jgi:MFS family permease
LITSILSAGTFFGAIIAGNVADFIGRKFRIIMDCTIFIVGIITQTASSSVGVLAAGRFIFGLDIGFESAIVVLYMSESAPKKVRGALVSGYQFCITIGLLLASCVDYGTKAMTNSGSYRIPIAIQFLWALILGCSIASLPDCPRYFVKRGKIDKAIKLLSSLRGQPAD